MPWSVWLRHENVQSVRCYNLTEDKREVAASVVFFVQCLRVPVAYSLFVTSFPLHQSSLQPPLRGRQSTGDSSGVASVHARGPLRVPPHTSVTRPVASIDRIDHQSVSVTPIGVVAADIAA
ncbi:hypothetical protein EVAR_19435_1 [Eumeta japonica]|uniref:Uncharacterized protein n=1 Tax=Eumeta variegata TaxID=151549 RepID=A0A4C1TRY3_EUMVA|nr:hypothetical protein EVAR_19435_1 [Eumeta japonica]